MKVFVIALESEAQCVLHHLKNSKERLICGKRAVQGDLFGEEVALIVCGVGKVNAACGAQAAADIFDADCIINIGVAGGLNDSLQVGDIYAISRAVQYDFDLVQLNGTPIGTLNEFESRYLPLECAGNYPQKTLATGDRFNDDPADYALITKEIGADIRDMEGAAIAQAGIHASIPVYAFKCISDIAGSGSTTEQFTQNLKRCNENLTKEIPIIMAAIHG